VIVIMLDGCRPDILRRAKAPVLHGSWACPPPRCTRTAGCSRRR
jgi:hypothetical protein